MGKFADLKSQTVPLLKATPQAEPLHYRVGKQLGETMADALTGMLNAPVADLEAAVIKDGGVASNHNVTFSINENMGWFDIRVDKLKVDGVNVYDQLIYGDSIKKMLNVACLTIVSKHPDLFAVYQFDEMACATVYINDESFEPARPVSFSVWKWLKSLFVPHKVGV